MLLERICTYQEMGGMYMLYVRTDSENGVTTFTPMKNNNIYIHCLKCNRMEQVVDLLDFVAELGEANLEAKTFDICHECFEEECRLEEEYLEKQKPGK